MNRQTIVIVAVALLVAVPQPSRASGSCPLSIDKFRLIGYSTDGHDKRYAITLGASHKNTVSARVALQTSDGRDVATLDVPAFTPVLYGSIFEANVDAWVRGDLIVVATVSSVTNQPEGSTVACTPAGVPVQMDDGFAAIVGMSEPSLEPPMGITVVASAVMYFDAHFQSRVFPEYPSIAMYQAISGASLVRVELDPKGKLVKASTVQSSGSTLGNGLMDRASITAASRSTYAPATYDGTGVASENLVSYLFLLDTSPLPAPGEVCPITLRSAQFNAFGEGGRYGVLSVDATSDTTTLDSVELTAEVGGGGPGASLAWSRFEFPDRISEDRLSPGSFGRSYNTQGEFLWVGNAMQSVGVRRIVADSGHRKVSCGAWETAIKSNPAVTVGHAGLQMPAFTTGTPLYKAVFAHFVKPQLTAVDAPVIPDAYSDVLVFVGPHGVASDAELIASSGNASFEDATLKAALGSTYVVQDLEKASAVRAYRVRYDYAATRSSYIRQALSGFLGSTPELHG